MEKKEGTRKNSNSISTEDILKSLESFGNRTKSPEPDRAKGEKCHEILRQVLANLVCFGL
jgi:hypothetical protein